MTDDALTLEERLDELSERVAQLAEEVRNKRLVIPLQAQQAVGGDADAVVRPVALEGLSEADAVLDFKLGVLLVARWLQGPFWRKDLTAMREHYGERIGLDVFDALVSLSGG